MDVTGAVLPAFAFYLIIFCNFTPELMGCRLQTVLRESMVAKHAIGLLLMLFLVVLASPDNADMKLLQNVGIAVVAYVTYLMTTRISLPLVVLVLALLVATYVLGIRKKRVQDTPGDDHETKARRLHLMQNVLIGGILAITVVGFILYFLEKRAEYGSRFSYHKFVVGNVRCRKFTPTSARTVRY
jgi:predicted cobalt transporter CbtA